MEIVDIGIKSVFLWSSPQHIFFARSATVSLCVYGSGGKVLL